MEKELVESFTKHTYVKNTGSAFTIEDYKQDIRLFENYLNQQGIYSFFEVDRELAKYFIIYLKEEKIFSTSTIQRILSCMRSFYAYLEQNDLIGINPFAGLKGGKTAKKLPDVLSYDDVCYLLDSVDVSTKLGVRNKALFELMYSTGMRLFEIERLNINDINFEDESIVVKGKGSKERIVFFNQTTREAIENYLEVRPSFGCADDALWINRNGKRLTRRGIEKLLSDHCSKIGYNKRVHPHLLRHCFATHMLDAGADIKTIQCLLGHSNLAATQIYTHVSIQTMQRCFESNHIRNGRGDRADDYN